MRIAFIFAWTVLSLVGWMYACGFALKAYLALVQRFPSMPRPSPATADRLSIPLVATLFVGAFVVPIAAALLGIRGRLPGTRRRGVERRRGFTVVDANDRGDAGE